MLLISVGVWAQTTINVSDGTNKYYYAIKNSRGNVYAAYAGAGKKIALNPGITSRANLFYFKAGDTDGTYKIYSALNDKVCNGVNSWNDMGIDWYIKASGNTTYTGLAISPNSNLSDSWNNEGGQNKRVGTYDGNDPGSVWTLEEVADINTATISFSTDETKYLYNIRNLRGDKYADYKYAGYHLDQTANVSIGSYFYFVKDETATGVPNGYVACRVYNALNVLAVENPRTGNMTQEGKLYYLGIHENTNCGYVLRASDDVNASWNDKDDSYVTTHTYDDAGSIWAMCATTKTMASLESEMLTSINSMVNDIKAATEAGYYTYPTEDVQTAVSALSDIYTVTFENKCDAYSKVNKAHITLSGKTKSTDAPEVGDIIRLKNRKYGTFLTNTGTALEGTADYMGNNNTLWKIVEGDGTNVKLQNVATTKFIDQIRNSTEVSTVDATSEMFEITNQTFCYGVIKNTSGGDYAYAHINSSNKLVGWVAGADASQWIIESYSLKGDLAELISQTNAKFGSSVGLYASTSELANAVAEGQALVDSETATDEQIEAAISAINSNIPSALILNTPQKGKFYCFRNPKTGAWLSGGSSTVTKQTTKDDVAAVFYVGENNELLSYKGGMYYDCNAKDFAAVGVSREGVFEVAVGGPLVNTFTYKNNGKYMYGGYAGTALDRGDAPGSDNGYNWIMEEVTWLPIPMRTEEGYGYASLYSPVQLGLGYGNNDRVEVYTVESVNTDYVSLKKESCVPANTGVILKYLTGLTNGCVYLPVQATSITGVSKLSGSLADELVTDDAYVLSKPDDETIGLYRAMKNQTSSTANDSWLNNGFRAYLPASALPGTGAARMLTFDFGTETAIEGVEAAEAIPAGAAIYDLSGRRVQKTQKGLYIVNGKVVIK